MKYTKRNGMRYRRKLDDCDMEEFGKLESSE